MRKASSQQAKKKAVNLGTKRACPECGTKFYDFLRTELTCPKCEEVFEVVEETTPTVAAPLPGARKKAPVDSDDESGGRFQDDEQEFDDDDDDEDVDRDDLTGNYDLDDEDDESSEEDDYDEVSEEE